MVQFARTRLHRPGRRLGAVSLLAAAGMLLATAAPAGATTVRRVSGNAWAISGQVTVLGGINVTVPETPKVVLPHSGEGGSFTKHVVNVGTILGVLDAHTEGTTGPNGSSHSTADIANLNVPGVLTATAVHSDCTATPAGFQHHSSVLNLSVLGNPITSSGTINVIGGTITVVLNQVVDNTNNLRDGRVAGHVNAVAADINIDTLTTHVHLVLAHSHCDLTFRP
jgi:hypothetical protein